VSRRIVNDQETFLELPGGLDGESQIAVEATYGWEWLAELLEDAGYDMHLAHPLRTTRARMDDWSTSMTATPSANRHANNRSP
jgi:transposase